MSDPDSAQRRRPPTIDLTAQEVKTDRPADANESADAATASAASAAPGDAKERDAGRSPRRIAPYIFAGLIGAVGAAAVIVALWLAGFIPPGGSAVVQNTAGSSAAPAPRSTEMSDLEARLNKLEAAVQAKPPPDAGLAARLSDAEKQTKALSDAGRGPNSARRSDRRVHARFDSGRPRAAAAAAAAEKPRRRRKTTKVNPAISIKSLSVSRRLRMPSKRLTADAARASVERGRSRGARGRRGGGACRRGRTRRSVPRRACQRDRARRRRKCNSGADAVCRQGFAQRCRARPRINPSSCRRFARPRRMRRRMVRCSPGSRSTRKNSCASPAPIPRRRGTSLRQSSRASMRTRVTAMLLARSPTSPACRRKRAHWRTIGRRKREARETAVAASRRIAAEAVAALGKPAPQ